MDTTRAIPYFTASRADTGPAPLLRGTRRAIWAAFLLAVANGIFLYFLPGQAEAHYAWPIKPSINAAFMGAGYLAGVLPTALALFVARCWRSVWGLIWAFFTIAVVMLLATLLHADRFRWHYPLTWVWTGVYAGIPLAAAWFWVKQQHAASDDPPADARLMPVRVFAWALGGVLALLGLALFAAPVRMVALWPWPITPLLARAFAAWYLQMAAVLCFGGATLRQPREALIPISFLATFNLLLLALPLRYANSIATGDPGFWLWLALHAVLVIGTSGATIRAWSLMRAEGQRL
jgi:hypothetical protein